MHISGEVNTGELKRLRQQTELPDPLEDDFVPQPRARRGYYPHEYNDVQTQYDRYEAEDIEDLEEPDDGDFYNDEFSDADSRYQGYGYPDEDVRHNEADDYDDVDFATETQMVSYPMDVQPMDAQPPYSEDPESPAETEPEYAPKKKKKSHKVAAAFLTVFGIAIIGGGIWGAKTILDMGTASSSEQVGDVAAVKSGQLGASEEDVAMLKTHGYDAQQLAARTQEFCTAFFTFSPATVKDGSWQKAFSKYTIDVSEMTVSSNENMISTRSKDDWKSMIEGHPGFEGSVIGYESLKFGLSEDKLPYCDIVAVVSRPELDRYTTNSPALIIDKALDTYRVVFNKEGKVISVRRLQYRVLEQNSDANLAAADARAVEKNVADTKKAAEEAAKKKAEEEETAKKKAEEEETAKKKAEEEDKAKKEAEEKAEAEAKKQAEEEAAAAKKKAEEEAAAAKKQAEEEAAAAKKKAEEEAARKQAEEEAKRKAEAEAAAAAERNANEATA